MPGVLFHPLQHLLGALDPGLRQRDRQAKDAVARQVEGDHHRCLDVPDLDRTRERPFARLDGHRELPRPPRGLGKQFERFGGQRFLGIGCGQPIERRPPLVTVKRSARRLHGRGYRQELLRKRP